ncbi:MAG: CPBP family intramembrane metalloprotease [Anaerolineae bacterium]|nr:CPBP family intramembrane metalloprotease [Anaerolineae bacterium]
MTRTIFWNDNEHRVRFFWRLAVYALLLAILTAVFSVLLSPSVTAAGVIEYTRPSTFLSTGGASLVATAIATAVTAPLLDRRPIKDYGLRFNGAWWRDFGFGLALGAGLMSVIFVVEWAAGWITIAGTLQSGGTGSFAMAFLFVVGGFLCIGIYEEVAFRGFGLTNVAEWLHRFGPISARSAVVAATLLTALLFGALHAMNPNAGVISTVNIVIAGATLLSLGLLLTGELAIPIGVHITWNLFQAAIFGFPVSGLDLGTTVVAVEQGGPTWLTGGAFGPEAGVLGLVAMLAGSRLTVLWVRWTRGKVALAHGIAEPPRGEKIT